MHDVLPAPRPESRVRHHLYQKPNASHLSPWFQGPTGRSDIGAGPRVVVFGAAIERQIITEREDGTHRVEIELVRYEGLPKDLAERLNERGISDEDMDVLAQFKVQRDTRPAQSVYMFSSSG